MLNFRGRCPLSRGLYEFGSLEDKFEFKVLFGGEGRTANEKGLEPSNLWRPIFYVNCLLSGWSGSWRLREKLVVWVNFLHFIHSKLQFHRRFSSTRWSGETLSLRTIHLNRINCFNQNLLAGIMIFSKILLIKKPFTHFLNNKTGHPLVKLTQTFLELKKCRHLARNRTEDHINVSVRP